MSPILISKWKKFCKQLFKLSLYILGFMLAKSFSESKTNGFTFTRIDRDITYDPVLETPSDFKEKEAVFSQPFYFLDRGGQSYVFISQDQTLILKFFKKHYNIPDPLIQFIDSLLPQSLKTYRFQFLKTRKEKFYPLFESCKLAHTYLKEETGLLYVHLNPTTDLPPLQVIDCLGIKHFVNANTTSFLIQKRADLIFSHIEEKLAAHDLNGAKHLIHNMIEYIKRRSQQGIGDKDNGLKRNYGYIGDKAVSLDLGSFVFDDSLKDPAACEAEVERKTRHLAQWISGSHPELEPYFKEELSKVLDP